MRRTHLALISRRRAILKFSTAQHGKRASFLRRRALIAHFDAFQVTRVARMTWTELLKLQDEFAAVKVELSRVQAESAARADEIAVLKAAADTFEGELVDAQAAATTLQGKLANAEAAATTLRGELADAKAAAAVLSGKLSAELAWKDKFAPELHTANARRFAAEEALYRANLPPLRM
jgi:chromosome segregation ATPase